MAFRDAGKVKSVRLTHPMNACMPISVSVLGKVILRKLVQLIKVLAFILTTPSGITRLSAETLFT